jgi:hypothetical protein
LDLLQENTWQKSESIGLHSRIDKLSGKRKVGFQGLDCLKGVVCNLKALWVQKNYIKVMTFVSVLR